MNYNVGQLAACVSSAAYKTFEFEESYRFICDFQLFSDIILEGSIFYVPVVTAYYRDRPDNLSSTRVDLWSSELESHSQTLKLEFPSVAKKLLHNSRYIRFRHAKGFDSVWQAILLWPGILNFLKIVCFSSYQLFRGSR